MSSVHKRFLLLVVSVFASFSISAAEDINLEKVVVTPYRYEGVLEKTSSSIDVIGSNDIGNSNAMTTVDLLRSESGVSVRDWYGTGTKAAVDMGGFGEQAALNVLVLVDGRRINDVDLSGTDWSQVPLDNVERIEVIRGGLGSVLYGDNAASGVINIITKKGKGKPKVDFKGEYGSYNMNKESLSLQGGFNNSLSYWLGATHFLTDGYRKNSYTKSKDFGSKLEYKVNEIISARFDSGFFASSYGMPGALYQVNIDDSGRRSARYGKDHANNKDYFFLLGAKGDFKEAGTLDIEANYRQKDTDSYFLTSGLYTQLNEIETISVSPKYKLANNIFGKENSFIAGFDFSKVFYSSNKCDQVTSALQNYTKISKLSLSGYLHDQFSVTEKLLLSGGYRYEMARYGFTYHDLSGWNPDINEKIRPNVQVFDTGIIYNYKDDSSLFLNIGKSFRFPEVDEFTYNDASWQQQLNTGLQPQTSINYQVGVRHKFFKGTSIDLSLFRMNVKNELYFNANGGPTGYGENQNYPKTVHQGLECSAQTALNSWLAISGNYTFTDAYFDGGEYAGNEIPMVAHQKAGFGIRLNLPKNFTFNLNGNYLGERRYLNDQANNYSRLNGYFVADTSLSCKLDNFKFTLAVSNLFNNKYSEYAGVLLSASGSYPAGSRFYYPNPGTNFSLKVECSF